MTTPTLNRPARPAQIPLVSAIVRELTKQGYPQANERQFNAVIRAADMVCDEFGKPHAVPEPGSGLKAWLLSDDTGMSSLALAKWLTPADFRWPEGVRVTDREAHPHDPGDFGRCVRMLSSEPSLRDRLDSAADISPVWARLAAAWSELEALYTEEFPTGNAPKLYARLQEIIDAGS